MIHWLLFMWWDMCPSLQIRLWRRADPGWPAAFLLKYRAQVVSEMTRAEIAYLASRMDNPS